MFAAVRVRLWKKGECPIPFLILCLTTLGSFAALFLADKLIGHKQMAQLDFFDYITGITIGSIAAEMATELEEPWKPLTAILIYGGVTVLLSIVTNKFPRSRKYLYGTSVILMDQGTIYRENLKKAKLDLDEFIVLCRQQGYFDLTSIQTAIFEYNGILTILPVSTQRPAHPAHYGWTNSGGQSQRPGIGSDLAGQAAQSAQHPLCPGDFSGGLRPGPEPDRVSEWQRRRSIGGKAYEIGWFWGTVWGLRNRIKGAGEEGDLGGAERVAGPAG